MNQIKALIIDDEPLAHNVILSYVKNIDDITIVGQCYSATEAIEFLAKQETDLLFLDINMPLLSGLDLLKVLKNKPEVIITSAYSEYALESFELDVTDYLLKPFPFERFLQACNKVRDKMELIELAEQTTDTSNIQQFIYIKVDNQQHRIVLQQVSCFEAYGNYVKVWREGSSVLTPRTLTSFEAELSDTDFVRIHKSSIINLNHLTTMDSQTVTLSDGMKLNIGKSYKNNLKERTIQSD